MSMSKHSTTPTYGTALNERLAECMGKKGKWTTFVGSLGSRTHMQWVGAGEANAKKYPDMQLVDPNNESFDDANGTYEKAKEILRKHPDLKGFQTSAGNDVLGVGRAIDEAGFAAKYASLARVCQTPPQIFWNPERSQLSASGIRKGRHGHEFGRQAPREQASRSLTAWTLVLKDTTR